MTSALVTSKNSLARSARRSIFECSAHGISGPIDTPSPWHCGHAHAKASHAVTVPRASTAHAALREDLRASCFELKEPASGPAVAEGCFSDQPVATDMGEVGLLLGDAHLVVWCQTNLAPGGA